MSIAEKRLRTRVFQGGVLSVMAPENWPEISFEGRIIRASQIIRSGLSGLDRIIRSGLSCLDRIIRAGYLVKNPPLRNSTKS